MITQFAHIPEPPLRNIEIGPLTLHGYGLTMGIAIIVAIWIAEWGQKRQGVDISRFTPFALITVLGGFIGARLYHVASKPTYFLDNPGELPAVWHGGLGIYGAIAGGTLTALWLAPKFGLRRGALADAMAASMLAAQAIGRFGNYLNQELFGKPFDGAWGLEVDEQYRPEQYADTILFHPTFLYEMIGTGLLAVLFAVLLVKWRSRASGVLFPLYVAAYSVVRICVEPLRIDNAHEWAGIRQNVWVAGVLIIVGLAIAAWLTQREQRRVG